MNLQQKIESFLRHFEVTPKIPYYYNKINKVHSRGRNSLILYYEDVLSYDPYLAEQLQKDPEYTLSLIVDAFRQLLKFHGDLHYSRYFIYIFTRDKDSVLWLPIRQLRAHHIGHLVLLKGIVTRTSQLRFKLIKSAFLCNLCGSKIEIIQLSEKLRRPKFCINKRCKAKALSDFHLINHESEFIDWQGLTVQELPEELSSGKIPRSIDCILQHDLVDTIRPGDRVSIAGIVSIDLTRSKNSSNIQNPFIKVNYIQQLGQEKEDPEVTQADLAKFKVLSKKKGIQMLIAHSIAPDIYGRDDLKLACALSLFSGPRRYKDGKGQRENIHVLFVGDPGTGKSFILKGAVDVAPRGLYTSGKSSSAVGLTAAVVKDPDTSQWNLEAGAIILANGGIAGIDELDKMTKEDRSALHEALEQQTVSIAKAGIVATLRAETAVISAANPFSGRYDTYKTPTQNIKLPPSLLSRFDLIFVVIDKPDPSEDKKMADFILTEKGAPPASEDTKPYNIIDRRLLRKYIAYAKKNCNPALTKEASEAISEFYLKLRGEYEGENAIVSILARHLEALFRLSKAYAKMSLSKKITKAHVEAIIVLFSRFVRDIGYDPETGKIDIDRVFLGQGHTAMTKLDTLLTKCKEIFELQEWKPLEKAGLISGIDALIDELDKTYITRTIEELIKDGTFYEPKPGYIKFTKQEEE